MCFSTLRPALLLCKFINPLKSLVSDSFASVKDLAYFNPNFTLLLQPDQSNSPLESLLFPFFLLGSHSQLESEPSLQAINSDWTTPADAMV